MGAINTGMNAILVKTGKYTEGDENKIEKKPLYVAKNFADAVDFFIENFTAKS